MVSSDIELFCHYMRMFLSGKMYLKGFSFSCGTLDGQLQVASNRCPVRTLLTKLSHLFQLIIAFSFFFIFQLLISLKISDGNYYYPHELEKFLPRFEKLQDLDIAGLDVEDSCLEVLGAFCKELR